MAKARAKREPGSDGADNQLIDAVIGEVDNLTGIAGDTPANDDNAERPGHGSSGEAGEYVNPADLGNAAAPADGTAKRGRGRPKGSGKGSGAGRKAASNSTGDLTSLLFSLHLMGASFLKIEELALSEDESARLAAAVQNVTEQYDVPLLDPKTLAWVQLGMAAASIYGPRIVVASARTRREKREAARGNVQVISPHESVFHGAAN